ncbi:hypothetical protein [Streptomyces monashensis]|uniref:hypothetical protein n=1 Tax=Streptomyces monashensis TaxID=1678012 RepID=UPI0015A6853D
MEALLFGEVHGGRGHPAIRHDSRDVGAVDLPGGAVEDLRGGRAHGERVVRTPEVRFGGPGRWR